VVMTATAFRPRSLRVSAASRSRSLLMAALDGVISSLWSYRRTLNPQEVKALAEVDDLRLVLAEGQARGASHPASRALTCSARDHAVAISDLPRQTHSPRAASSRKARESAFGWWRTGLSMSPILPGQRHFYEKKRPGLTRDESPRLGIMIGMCRRCRPPQAKQARSQRSITARDHPQL
jgi:hypothetical protein